MQIAHSIASHATLSWLMMTHSLMTIVSIAQSVPFTVRIARLLHTETTPTQSVVVNGVPHAMRTIHSTAKAVASPILTTGLTTM